MLRKPFFIVVAIVCTALHLGAPRELHAATQRQVEIAIARAKSYLYSQQKNGNWEEVQDVPKPYKDDHSEVKGKQWGGITAVATYALLAAGESPQNKQLAQAIDFLQKHRDDMNGVYAVGMRCQVWPYLSPTATVRACAKRDATFLQEAMIRQAKDQGYYNYVRATAATKGWFDRSVSQYGVLGMWACEQAGVEVPRTYWQIVDEAWKRGQKQDGGWSYNDDAIHDTFVATPSMTAAGVASLFITQDYTRMNEGVACKGNISNESIDKGMEWLTKNFPTNLDEQKWKYYLLYGIERCGVASGYKYFGTIDWYKHGADYLVTHQNPDGSWNNEGSNIPNTSWGILFLVRGRAPVVMNKLQYDLEPENNKPVVARWNQRPRDAANLTYWAGKQSERFLNWQIVNLKVPVEELHDSPILYIAGDQKLNFSADDVAKLKLYVEQGGLILGNADCGNKAFADSFRKLGQTMFPSYEFRELPNNHPIYTEEQFPRSKWKSPPSVVALSNDVRELMILLPTADAGKSWQTRDTKGKAELFQLGTNIFLYCVEKQNLRFKGNSHIVVRDPKISATKKLKLARLEYPGNWNPEPGGWQRMKVVLANKSQIDLDVQTVKISDKKLDAKTYPFAHLTGTAPFKLTADQQAELKKYIEGGGTLIIDAAGGSTAFMSSVEAELAAILPDAKRPYATIPAASPLAAAMKNLDLRKFASKTIGSTKTPLPKAIDVNGRLAVIVSPLDLSVGLVGQSVDGVAGYDPDSAVTIMSAILKAPAK